MVTGYNVACSQFLNGLHKELKKFPPKCCVCGHHIESSTRRVEEMAVDIKSQIQETVTKCKYFSLVLDETCDLTIRSKFVNFVQCVDEHWYVLQDSLEFYQLERKTQEKDIFLKIKDCIEK